TLRGLVRDADVFSQGYRPGTLGNRGFSPEALAQSRPGIVVVSLCAFSHVGPWASRRGFDTVVQTVSGITSRQGELFPGAAPGPRCRSATTSRNGRRGRSHRGPMTDIQFGLMLRAQFPAGDDMQRRFAELVEQARLADRLGFASITKGMHYSAAPWWDLQQFPFLSRIMADAPNLRLNFGLVL